MADIDNLEIQITAESDKAVSDLGKLKDALEKLEAVGHKSGYDNIYRNLKKIASVDFSSFAANLEKAAAATEKIAGKTERLQRVVSAMNGIKNATADARVEFEKFGSPDIPKTPRKIPYQNALTGRQPQRRLSGGIAGVLGDGNIQLGAHQWQDMGSKINANPFAQLLFNIRQSTRKMGEAIGQGFRNFRPGLSQGIKKDIASLKALSNSAKSFGKDLAGTFSLLRAQARKANMTTFGYVRKGLKSWEKQAGKTRWSMRYLAKTVARYAIYKMLNLAIKNVTRGLQNLALYSKEANAVLTEYKTIGLQLGNSIATAVVPVLQALLPLMRVLSNLLIHISNSVNVLFSAMNGQKTFIRAKEYVDDYAKSLGKLRSAASIDELHTIGQSYNYSEMFETVDIDFSTIMSSLGGVIEALAIIMGFGLFAKGVELSKVLSSLTGTTISFAGVLKKAGGVLLTIVGVIETIKGVSDAWVNGLDWSNFAQILIGIAATVGGLFLTIGAVGAQIGGILGAVVMVVTGIKDAITNGLNWTNGVLIAGGTTLLGAVIGSFFGPLGILIGAAIGALVGLLTDLITWIVQNWDTVANWFIARWTDVSNAFSKVWKAVGNAFAFVINGIITGFEAFVNFFIKGINAIIGGINKISFDVPDWVPGIGGKSVGFNIGYVSEVKFGRIPTYETGGFPEDGFFMANHNELIGQFSNGRTAVANNEQIIEGIARGVSEATSDQNELLREQNRILTRLLGKNTNAVVSVSTIAKGFDRQNRRNGKTIVPVGT